METQFSGQEVCRYLQRGRATKAHSKALTKLSQLPRLLFQFRVPALVVAEARCPLEAAGTAVDGAFKRQLRRVQPRVRARVRPEPGHDATAGVGTAKAHRRAGAAPAPAGLDAQSGRAGGRLRSRGRLRGSPLGRGAWRWMRHRRSQQKPPRAQAAAPCTGRAWRRGPQWGAQQLERRRMDAVRWGCDSRAGAHQRRASPRRRLTRHFPSNGRQRENAQRGHRGFGRQLQGASPGGLESTNRRPGA